MCIAVVDYPTDAERLAELGCPFPTSLALLPANFETAESPADFIQAQEASTVRKLLREQHVPVEELRSPGPSRVKITKSFDWVAPMIFVSAAVLSQDPTIGSVGINVLSNYLTELLKGLGGSRTVKLEVVVERKKDRTCKRIIYEGDPSGLAELSDAIKRLADE